MLSKLTPYNYAKVSFPGFQSILDFTAVGSESSVSVTVDGDVDKEYYITIRNLNAAQSISTLLNSAVTGYGYQRLINDGGTLSAEASTDTILAYSQVYAFSTIHLCTPQGLLKICMNSKCSWSSGTTINLYRLFGSVLNSTSNVTSIDFISDSGNFTAGSQISVYVRRT